MNINSINLLELQTSYMKQDKTTKGLCAALTPQLQAIAQAIIKSVILPNVDDLSVEVLDELAWELHIDWYDSSAPIEVKREFVRNSDKVHSNLGTAYAVEQVLKDYFGDGSVEEWFEYDGQPYHFKVNVPAFPVSDVYDKALKLISSVKNTRSYLDTINATYSITGERYVGTVTRQAKHITLLPG